MQNKDEMIPSVSCCTECSNELLTTTNSVKKLRKTFCSDCWIHHCNFRFRKRIFELGKPNKGSNTNLLLAPTETVLIYYDGSPSSVALINLIRDAINSSATKDNIPQRNLPFPFNFIIFVILESDDIGGSGTEGRQKKHLIDLLKWLKTAHHAHNVAIPLYASSIELSFRNPIELKKEGLRQIVEDRDGVSDQNLTEEETQFKVEKIALEDLSLPFHQNHNSQLTSVFSSMKTKTSQRDLDSIVKQNLIASVAKSLQISKVILPEDQTSLAIKMFTIMSLGRGGQLAELMGFTTAVVSREGGVVTFARPLMDFVSDDLRQYLQCLPQESREGLFNASSPTKSRKMKIDSLERQCDNFIVELQTGFPSTVPTLAKIGEKICPTVSSSGKNGSGTLLPRRQCKLCKRVEEESDQDDLCYGCSNISREMKEPELLRKLIEREDWV